MRPCAMRNYKVRYGGTTAMATVSIQEYSKALDALEKAIALTKTHENDPDLF